MNLIEILWQQDIDLGLRKEDILNVGDENVGLDVIEMLKSIDDVEASKHRGIITDTVSFYLKTPKRSTHLIRKV